MNEMRGRPIGTKFGDFKPVFTEGKSAEPDLRAQPELKAFDAAVNAASAEETAAKFAYAPDLVLQGMLMKPKAMPAEGMSAPMQQNWGFMVGVNVPLFFAWKQAPLVTAARLEKEAASLERQSLEARLNTELVDAREQFRTALNIVELYRTSVIPSTKLAAGNARAAYAAKRFPLTQYLEILKLEQNQDLELLAARIDVEMATSRLENLLSAPPVTRFAPSRPSLFGGMGGPGMLEMPETASMGKGTIGPKKPQSGGAQPSSGSGGMEGM
jgi:outer membrane protein TolC